MNSLKIATSLSVRSCFTTQREVVDVLKTDFCDIGAAVVSVEDVQNGIIDKMNATGLKLPIFVAVCCEDQFPDDFCADITGVFELCDAKVEFYGKQVETAVRRYQESLLPPFFGTLKKYVDMGNPLLLAQAIKVVSSSVSIRLVASSLISLVKPYSARICVTRTYVWVTC